jgi:hypothetical protein
VWQGSAGDRRPYADLVGQPEVIQAASNRLNWRQISRLPSLTLEFLALLSFLPVSSPLEVVGDILPGSDVFQ